MNVSANSLQDFCSKDVLKKYKHQTNKHAFWKIYFCGVFFDKRHKYFISSHHQSKEMLKNLKAYYDILIKEHIKREKSSWIMSQI